MNRVRGVEAEPVKMKFLDPITAVGDEEFADWCRIRTVEINHVAPFVSFPPNQIIVGINAQIISVWSEMVVNDVENYTEA